VANPTANSVSVFDTVNGNVLLTTITGGGLNVPTAVALDALGNVYVTNGAGNSISVFTANAYAPATILTGEGSNAFSGPAGIAFKTASFNSGNLLVANAGDNSLGVILLDPDSSAPTGYDYNSVYKLTNLSLNVPQGVTVAPDGIIYFANSGNNSVVVWPGFGVAASTFTGPGLDVPEGVAVDASGKLYVTNFGANSVSVFDTLNGNKLLTTITGGGLDGPTGVVIR
jgi:YVTN family beta-propeller protein